MRFAVSFVALFAASKIFSSPSKPTKYICSYPSYSGNKLVLVDIFVDGDRAKIDDDDYRVLQDTDLGIVMVRSFAQYNAGTKADDLGLFGVVIDKKHLKFTRGNILNGGEANRIAKGDCKKI
jgi:hypothetical protein